MDWKGKVTVIRDPLADGVALGDSVVPSACTLNFDGENGAPSYQVDFVVEDGAPLCTAITMRAGTDGRSLRTSHLHSLNVGRLMRYALTQWAVPSSMSADLRLPVRPDLENEQLWAVIADIDDADAVARRGANTPANLEEVARIYRENVRSTPTQAVADILGLSERTAARRVQQARAAGLLPKTTPGKRKA